MHAIPNRNPKNSICKCSQHFGEVIWTEVLERLFQRTELFYSKSKPDHVGSNSCFFIVSIREPICFSHSIFGDEYPIFLRRHQRNLNSEGFLNKIKDFFTFLGGGQAYL